MKKHNSYDYVTLLWVVSLVLVSCLLLYFVGLDGLVNHGDTGFPLNPVQRLIDGLWAWQPRFNFGVPQYLAHATLLFDAIRAIPDVLGLPVILQSQMYFVGTLIAVGVAAERLISQGLKINVWYARIIPAILITFNPFNISQILGGQGLQLVQFAALMFVITFSLEYFRYGRLSSVGAYALATMFIGPVFLPFVFILLLLTYLMSPDVKMRKLVLLASATILANLFWIVPLIARTLTAPVVSEIFQRGSEATVLDATKSFSILSWVLRLGYGHYPLEISYAHFLKSPLSSILGLIVTAVVLSTLSFVRTRKVRAIGIFWMIFVLFATGIHYRWFAPVYYWCFDHIPFFQAYRVPAKFLLVVIPLQAMLLAIWLDAWAQIKSSRLRIILGNLTIIGLGFVILLNGGIFHWRTVGKAIDLARYPVDYYERQSEVNEPVLEILPVATAGGYVPTQDMPLPIVRTYTPALLPFDYAYETAVKNKTQDLFLAQRGIRGVLYHKDIKLIETMFHADLYASHNALVIKPNSIPAQPFASVLTDPLMINNVASDSDIVSSLTETPFVTTNEKIIPSTNIVWRLGDGTQAAANPSIYSPALPAGNYRLILTVIADPGFVHLSTNRISNIPLKQEGNNLISDSFVFAPQDQLMISSVQVQNNGVLVPRNGFLVTSDYPTIKTNEVAASFTGQNRVHYAFKNLTGNGLLTLRMSDDPWWVAVSSDGNILPKVGKLYGLFPVWQLNGSRNVEVIYMGQKYLVIGASLTFLSLLLYLTILCVVRYRKIIKH